jgi:hypothetical protein
MLQTRFIGRFKMNDGKVAARTGDYEPPAQKVLIAEYDGEHFFAEKNAEGKLCIYSIGNSDGLPGVEVYGATADRAPKTMTDLQRVYDAAYAKPETPRQKLDRQSASQVLADRVRTAR